MRKKSFIEKGEVGHLSKKPYFLLLILFSFFSILSVAQQKVTGKVTSADAAIEGATIQVKGATTATITDAAGNFAISAPGNSTLVISYVGYLTREVKVSNQTFINVVLQVSNQQLGEVVVVGYGTQKKATLTGSVSTVAGSDIVKRPSPNVTSSLYGSLTGILTIHRKCLTGR